MGCRFPKMFSFLPEKLVNLWNLCKFLHFGFSFYAQIALKQRIDFKHCLSSAGITRKSFFLSKNCPISAPLKVDCSGLSGRQLKKGVNFWFLLEMNGVEWQGSPVEYLGRCVITDKNVILARCTVNWNLLVIRSLIENPCQFCLFVF